MNKPEGIRFSIKLKTILYNSLMVAFICAVSTSVFLTRMIKNLKDEVEKRALSETKNLAYDSKYGVLTEDRRILATLIENRITQPDILYVSIQNASRKVLASSPRDLSGKILEDDLTNETLAKQESIIKLHNNKVSPHWIVPLNSEVFYEVSVPIVVAKTRAVEDVDGGWDSLELGVLPDTEDVGSDSDAEFEILGTARLGLSLKSTNQKRNAMISFSAIFTFSVIILSIAISIFVSRITVAPLIDMAKVASQIANGDLDSRVIVKTRDEIGLMANNFNLMAAKLKKSIGGLENKVKERTIELEEAGIKTEAIIQNMVDGLVAVDINEKIFLANRAFEKMTGNFDIIGKNINTVLGVISKPSETTLNNNQEVIVHDDLILKITSSLIKHDETILGVVMLLRDITVEKEIDRMKTDFISNVSHELRTPLTSVLGFASNTIRFYRKDIKPVLPTDNKKVARRSKAIEENLTIIVSEGERLTRLINEVLDISKMEQGKIEWNIQDVDIIEICRHALNTVAGYPKSDQVKIVLEAPENVPPIRGDHDRLIQVIANFMSNALKVTQQGTITLKVEALEDHVKVSVKDTGPGIEEHHLTTIFEKFKQVGNILTNKAKGTGLGLPICKQIIEQFGGTINVESQVGVGSCFYFTVGYSTTITKTSSISPMVNKRTIVEEIILKIPPPSAGGKSNILVVDDDAQIRKMLRQELEDADYNVMESENGTEALTLLKNEQIQIDLIILDIMMPQVDGFDVLSAIKTNEKLAHIPVIVVSAYSEKSKVYRLGADSFVTKPIDNIKLNSLISSLLKEPIEKKVLIIEHEGNIASLIKSEMEGRGNTVIMATSAEQGFKSALAEKPDMVMIDLDLTKIQEGMELIKKLRTNEATCNMHIVLIADDMNENDRKFAECLNLGLETFDPFISSR